MLKNINVKIHKYFPHIKIKIFKKKIIVLHNSKLNKHVVEFTLETNSKT